MKIRLDQDARTLIFVVDLLHNVETTCIELADKTS